MSDNSLFHQLTDLRRSTAAAISSCTGRRGESEGILSVPHIQACRSQTPGGLGVPVPLFSMGTRRKHVSTSKHLQELSIIPLPVVWETMKRCLCTFHARARGQGRAGEGKHMVQGQRKNVVNVVQGSLSLLQHTQSLLMAKTSSGKDQNTSLEDEGHAPTH